ncbi:MAG: arginase family protein [bacterium]|nr:arginase family protein [bacterium]
MNENLSEQQNPHSSQTWRYIPENLEDTTIDVVMYPTDLGKPTVGTAKGPEYIMDNGLEHYLSTTIKMNVRKLFGNKGVDATYREPDDVMLLPNTTKNQEGIIIAGKNAADRVEQSLHDGNKVLTLRGDHSGLHDVAGALRHTKGEMGMVYIDTHFDLQNPETSTSHNAHGMPLRTLLGDGGSLNAIMENTPALKGENLVIIGISEPDPEEFEFLEKHPEIAVFTTLDIKTRGWPEVFKAIDEVQSRVPVWFDMDVDSLQGGATPMEGGEMSHQDLKDIASFVGSNAKKADRHGVVGIGIAEFLPPDPNAKRKDRKAQEERADVTINTIKSVTSRLLGASKPELHEYDPVASVRAQTYTTRSRFKKAGILATAASAAAIVVGSVGSYFQSPVSTSIDNTNVATATSPDDMQKLIYSRLQHKFRENLQNYNNPDRANASDIHFLEMVSEVQYAYDLSPDDETRGAVGRYVLSIISQELDSTKCTETFNAVISKVS